MSYVPIHPYPPITPLQNSHSPTSSALPAKNACREAAQFLFRSFEGGDSSVEASQYYSSQPQTEAPVHAKGSAEMAHPVQ